MSTKRTLKYSNGNGGCPRGTSLWKEQLRVREMDNEMVSLIIPINHESTFPDSLFNQDGVFLLLFFEEKKKWILIQSPLKHYSFKCYFAILTFHYFIIITISQFSQIFHFPGFIMLEKLIDNRVLVYLMNRTECRSIMVEVIILCNYRHHLLVDSHDSAN